MSVLLLTTPAILSAQDGHDSRPRYTVAFVPDRHWSLESARRLHALGLAPLGYDPARRAQTQSEVAAVLAHGVAALDSGRLSGPIRAGLEADLEADLGRYAREFGVSSAAATDLLSGSRAQVGYRSQSGGAATGWGYEVGHVTGVEWRPAENQPSASGGFVRADLQVRAGSDASFRAAGLLAHESDAMSLQPEEIYAAGGLGAFALWGGRRSTGYQPGATGGIVLTDVALDGIGIQTRRSVLLPWFLSAIGPVSAEVSLSQRDRPRSFDDVLFLTMRAALQPHRRVNIGVTRAVEFGGEGNYETDLFAIFSVLIGKHAGEGSEFDNQVVALDAGYRLPTERLLPIRAYIEWGFEDSAGAWKDVPGILAGVEAPAIPGAEWLSVAIERTSFADECCGNPIWYRNLYFQDGWTVDGRPLGHPLGGEGTEWAVILRANRGQGEWQGEAQLLHRDRRRESLYEPVRVGRSLGGSARLEWTMAGRTGIFLGLLVEDGEGWRETALRLGLQVTH